MASRPPNPTRARAILELVLGVFAIAAGIAINYVSFDAGPAGGGYVIVYGPIVGGVLAVVRGIVHLFPDDLIGEGALRGDGAPLRAAPLRASLEVAAGVALVIAGALYASSLYRDAVPLDGDLYALPPVAPWQHAAYAACVLGGLVVAGLGLARASASLRRFDFSAAFGYRTFVAWRYLLVFKTRVSTRAKALTFVGVLLLLLLIGFGWFEVMHPVTALQLGLVTGAYLAVVIAWGVLRYSKPSTALFVGGVVLAIGAAIATYALSDNKPPPFSSEPDHITPILQALSIAQLAGAAIAGLALFFGTIRAFFTFFTTVPIGGVWIGTAALVCVLSVMSGFETDLREKILGSNAHIQITREDGEFVDWREAKAKLDKIPGIVASTPYATSEVVIAANNNGMNVIIKGIDPATVGNVTNLIAALEDKEAMKRLEPLIEDEGDTGAPLAPTPTDGVDPPPPDLPAGGEPIDFSTDEVEGAGAALGDAGVTGADDERRPDDTRLGTAPDAGTSLPPDLVDAIARDRARGPTDLDVAPAPPDDPALDQTLDPPPPDMATSATEPRDFTAVDDDALGEPAIAVSDDVFEPSLSRRTQALPGILVGRELVKQTHLYNGQEVRVVSPLSDPSNPDATGTPIPFNRDYRVAGVFYTGMYEYDLKYVYVTLESLQDFLDRGETVDGIEVRIRDADDTGRYVPTSDGPGLIRQALGPGYRVQDWRELNRSLFSALKLEKIAMFLVLGIVILVASFSIVGNLIMVVVEKQREIALLKTLGASDTGVTHVFAVQGLIIGVIGSVLGVATGLAGCWAGKKYGLPLNPDVYYIDRLPIHVDPESVVAAALAGVVISIAATLYPALLAARVRPAAGLRH